MDKLGQEWVSSVVDGEASEQDLAHLSQDKDAQEKWQNYHLIGDTIRGELPPALSLDLTQSIADAIEKEPSIVAPGHANKPVSSDELSDVVEGNPASVVGLDIAPTAKPSNVVPLFKQLGQYAIAASVALVAVIGVQNYNVPADIESSPLPVLNTRPLIGSASPVSLQTGQPKATSQNASQGYSEAQLNEQRRRINTYIQDHMLQQKLNTAALHQHKSEKAQEEPQK
ncbi:sigma-E factor negative regulatory protein [Shewanella gelidii]|uniref:Anti-sigma-E factor RseA n=1 Tax=Shewanella gelidii TaxID=1642821 RepID=A0A917JIL3_9GAMM|nr:RseA family anti-sigma factor [Shewanella gelidii]MCL1096673.1 anti-sigma factor [Shewanella gelidii]GGI69405.1 anti-sigma-E factor RseA [Shewanella gelidii]